MTGVIGDDMRMVRSALLGLVAASALAVGAGTASAEGMPGGRYSMSWTGFYVGIQGGYGWGDTKHHDGGASTGTFDISGGLAGVTWGTNWQRGNVVLVWKATSPSRASMAPLPH